MPEPEFMNVPPAEAVRNSRAKGYHVGFDWRDTAAAEHVRSFTVAKATRLDILEDIRGAVDRALAEGTTFRQFQTELEPLLRAKGWWGRESVIDPVTGQARVVQLGSVRRLRIIFDTNLRTSYARGRWERIQRTKETTPWLRYNAILDERTRPEHLAWHGTVLPVDHPWWETNYPPNGWRCRCIVQQLSDDDLEDFGYEPSPGPPPGSERTRPWTNKRTGETIRVPVGIDPGFGHNVGLAGREGETADRLIARIDAADNALARAAIGSPWNTPLFRRHLDGAPGGDWPVAVVPQAILAAIGGRSRAARLSSATALKQADRHFDLEAEDYARAQRILDEGEIFKAGDRLAIGFIEEEGRPWRIVVKATEDGSETYLVSLHKAQPRDLDTARRRLARIEREGE